MQIYCLINPFCVGGLFADAAVTLLAFCAPYLLGAAALAGGVYLMIRRRRLA